MKFLFCESCMDLYLGDNIRILTNNIQTEKHLRFLQLEIGSFVEKPRESIDMVHFFALTEWF